MGLLNFFKGVGEKVFGKHEDAPAATNAGGDAEPLKASALLNHVKQLGLPFETLTIKTKGETVTIEGRVAKQEDSEKIALAVGNVEGVTSVDNQLEVDSPEAEAKFHTVEEGDTLSAISKKVYGDPMKYGVIFEANKPMLKSPDLIYPGQVLRIPQL